jgi:hypothetical protein
LWLPFNLPGLGGPGNETYQKDNIINGLPFIGPLAAGGKMRLFIRHQPSVNQSDVNQLVKTFITVITIMRNLNGITGVVHPSTDAATNPAAKKRVQNTSRSAHSLYAPEKVKRPRRRFTDEESSSRKESGISGQWITFHSRHPQQRHESQAKHTDGADWISIQRRQLKLKSINWRPVTVHCAAWFRTRRHQTGPLFIDQPSTGVCLRLLRLGPTLLLPAADSSSRFDYWRAEMTLLHWKWTWTHLRQGRLYSSLSKADNNQISSIFRSINCLSALWPRSKRFSVLFYAAS